MAMLNAINKNKGWLMTVVFLGSLESFAEESYFLSPSQTPAQSFEILAQAYQTNSTQIDRDKLQDSNVRGVCVERMDTIGQQSSYSQVPAFFGLRRFNQGPLLDAGFRFFRFPASLESDRTFVEAVLNGKRMLAGPDGFSRHSLPWANISQNELRWDLTTDEGKFTVSYSARLSPEGQVFLYGEGLESHDRRTYDRFESYCHFYEPMVSNKVNAQDSLGSLTPTVGPVRSFSDRDQVVGLPVIEQLRCDGKNVMGKDVSFFIRGQIQPKQANADSFLGRYLTWDTSPSGELNLSFDCKQGSPSQAGILWSCLQEPSTETTPVATSYRVDVKEEPSGTKKAYVTSNVEFPVRTKGEVAVLDCK